MRKLARRAAAAVALAAASVAAPAQAFEIDYPALFEKFGDQVRAVSETERVLELPGPVTVIARAMEDGATRFTGLDMSGLGPAGCGFETLVGAIAFGQVCEGVLSAEELARLGDLAQQAAGFVSDNALVGGAIEAGALLSQALAAAKPLPCPAEGNKSAAYAGQIRALAAPEGGTALLRMLSQPRLPVCRAQTVRPEG